MESATDECSVQDDCFGCYNFKECHKDDEYGEMFYKENEEKERELREVGKKLSICKEDLYGKAVKSICVENRGRVFTIEFEDGSGIKLEAYQDDDGDSCMAITAKNVVEGELDY